MGDMSGNKAKKKAIEDQCKQLLGHGDVEESFRLVLENGSSPFSVSSVQMQGMLALRKGRFPDADKLIKQAMSLKTDHVVWKMAGDSAFLQCKYDEAEKCYREALKVKPDSPEINHDLGVAVVSQGRVDECLQHFARAIELAPERADFHHHEAIMLILAGQDAAGWDRMQWRLLCNGVTGTFPNPEKYWKGEPLEGKTIVIRTEQGWGDTIQFASYLPWFAARAKKVYFFCQRAMFDWAAHYFPGVEPWPNDAPPPLDHDYHVNIMCIPRLVPPGAYRKPPKSVHLGEGIGVCWFGSPTHKADHLRSVPIERFGVLAEAVGQNLLCLGYGRFADKPPFIDYLIDRCHDWLDTARIVKDLDLVITVDTAIAHLAGFLGVETWLLLPAVPDFRWGLRSETTHWYSSVKLYRQPAVHAWDPVFERVANDLRTRVSAIPPLKAEAA
jgi:hypothetical protein